MRSSFFIMLGLQKLYLFGVKKRIPRASRQGYPIYMLKSILWTFIKHKGFGSIQLNIGQAGEVRSFPSQCRGGVETSIALQGCQHGSNPCECFLILYSHRNRRAATQVAALLSQSMRARWLCMLFMCALAISFRSIHKQVPCPLLALHGSRAVRAHSKTNAPLSNRPSFCLLHLLWLHIPA